MAERMALELKDKVQASSLPLETQSGPSTEEKQLRDAMLALVALGYKQQEAKSLLDQIPADTRSTLDVEDIIRIALKPS